MSYEKTIEYKDFELFFEFEKDENKLKLLKWKLFDVDSEVQIPCRIESEFIEKQINKFLEQEWNEYCHDYIMDEKIALEEKRFSWMDEY